MSESSNPSFVLTEKAAQQINKILTKEPSGFFFRLAVSGGGCNGFKYNFTFDNSRSPDDVSIVAHGAEVVIDQASLGFLAGSSLDYKQELIGANFEVLNLNVRSKCGCGNSFSI